METVLDVSVDVQWKGAGQSAPSRADVAGEGGTNRRAKNSSGSSSTHQVSDEPNCSRRVSGGRRQRRRGSRGVLIDGGKMVRCLSPLLILFPGCKGDRSESLEFRSSTHGNGWEGASFGLMSGDMSAVCGLLSAGLIRGEVKFSYMES
jgi:hypothetical protein